MPDVEWIMKNCYMMRDNGIWAGEKQISYASPDWAIYVLREQAQGWHLLFTWSL